VNHTRHYTIVNSDTRDQHQYSVIVSAATIHSAHHPADIPAHTDPRPTKHVTTIHVSLASTRTHNTQKSNTPLQQFTDTARGQLRDRLNDKWIRLLKVPYPKRGTTTQNTAHSVNDLDTPIHTCTQLEKSSPSPKSAKIRVIYNQQYKIVHNDTSDLHQHSVNSEWRRNSQRTPPRRRPSHTNPGPTKPRTDTARDKQKTKSRINEYDTWLHTQFPELLMMSEWRSKHVEYYHQIKSIKSCISLVIHMIIWL